MTKIKGNNEFAAPFNRFGTDRPGSGWQKITLRDKDHTPYNKRPGSVDSLLIVEASRFMPNNVHTAGDHIGISFEEITTTGKHIDNPRTAGRTISHEFPMMEAVKLANFILECAAKHADPEIRAMVPAEYNR